MKNCSAVLLLLLSLSCRLRAQQGDEDCPPGTYYNNGNCVSSVRVRFNNFGPNQQLSSGAQPQNQGGNSNNNNYNNGPSSPSSFQNQPSGQNFGNNNSPGPQRPSNNNFNGNNGNFNNGNNYGNKLNNNKKKPVSVTPKPSPFLQSAKDPCPPGYILSSGICKPSYIHPHAWKQPPVPHAPYYSPYLHAPYGNCNYGHGYPYWSQHLQPQGYLGSPYYGAQPPYIPPYWGSHLCPPGYTYVAGACKPPSRVRGAKAARELEEDES